MATKNNHIQSNKGEIEADSEVTPSTKRKKRHLTAAYKQRVLAEIDELSYGEVGAYLRREGLYSSQIAKWRKQRQAGESAGQAGCLGSAPGFWPELPVPQAPAAP